MKSEDINKITKYLDILNNVAEKLKNGLITSGNIAHDGKIQGFTIENCVSELRKLIS